MVARYSEHIELVKALDLLKEAFSDRILKNITEMKISDALGCVLAEDITAHRNVPHYAASAVDGYALDASSTIGASQATPAKLGSSSYRWMNTGADIPHWANAVLMVEDSSLEGDDLLIFKSLTPSANVRPLGEDVMAGQIIAREGERVSPALISLFLCAGIDSVPVFKKPKTLYIPTGDEVIEREKWLEDPSPRSGTVAESNSLFIEASFREWGYEVDVSAVVPDDPAILKEKVSAGVDGYDVVLVGAGITVQGFWKNFPRRV